MLHKKKHSSRILSLVNGQPIRAQTPTPKFDYRDKEVLSPSKKHSLNSLNHSFQASKKQGLRMELDQMLQLAKNRKSKKSGPTSKNGGQNFGLLGKRSVVQFSNHPVEDTDPFWIENATSISSTSPRKVNSQRNRNKYNKWKSPAVIGRFADDDTSSNKLRKRVRTMQFSGLNLNTSLNGDSEVIEVLSQSQETEVIQHQQELNPKNDLISVSYSSNSQKMSFKKSFQSRQDKLKDIERRFKELQARIRQRDNNNCGEPNSNTMRKEPGKLSCISKLQICQEQNSTQKIDILSDGKRTAPKKGSNRYLLERQRKRHKSFKRSLQRPLLHQLLRKPLRQKSRGKYSSSKHQKFNPLKKQNLMKELEFKKQEEKMLQDLESGLKRLKNSTPSKQDKARSRLKKKKKFASKVEKFQVRNGKTSVHSVHAQSHNQNYNRDQIDYQQTIMQEVTLFQKSTRTRSYRPLIKAYNAQTSKGLYRDYNEDRVSIITNIELEDGQGDLQCSSFFGLFDGHAGSKCVDFIKDSIHEFITHDKHYLRNKQLAIKNGIYECEKEWLKIARGTRKSEINLNFINQLKLSEPKYDLENPDLKPVGHQMWDQYQRYNINGIDISGSCLTMSIFCEDMCYVANLGDSRIIMSKNNGELIQQLTTDHKPEAPIERARIEQNGGAIFRNRSVKQKYRLNKTTGKMEKFNQIRYGPHRVNPGGLSLSRSIGDLPSKAREIGGNPNCLVSCPEITQFKISRECDFMVLACDGVWDELSNQEVSDAVWETLETCSKMPELSLNEISRLAAEHVMKASFDKRSLDNISVIVILFKTKEDYLQGRKTLLTL